MKKIIVNGQEVAPCKKGKLRDTLSPKEIQDLLAQKRAEITKGKNK